jgi:hypothetical protein
MTYNTAVETGLAIIPILDDPDIVFSDEQKNEFREAVKVILTHEDIDDNDDESQDAISALNALRKVLNNKQMRR